ncbi:MAG TPA: hypothetical protein V6C65_22510, partial [Allocoleopsis sp.]
MHPSPHYPHQAERWIDTVEAIPRTVPIKNLDVTKGELATCLHDCVRLDWENLQCFEVVNHQFKHWGVTFGNAVALRPSNAAYPPYSGLMVVMGAPRNGWLEATFSRPVRFVSGFVTSTRRITLTAFDRDNQLVSKAESPGANSTHGSSIHAPNLRLSLNAANIHRITFHTFNGHL